MCRLPVPGRSRFRLRLRPAAEAALGVGDYNLYGNVALPVRDTLNELDRVPDTDGDGKVNFDEFCKAATS